VAVVAPYSGPMTSEGLSMLAGARLAAREYNRNGGLDGYRLEVIAPDERRAATPDDVIADPTVLAVVGHLESNSGRVGGIYRRDGIAWLATEVVDSSSGAYPLVAEAATVDRVFSAYLQTNVGLSGADAGQVVAACHAGGEEDGVVLRTSDVHVICGGEPAALSSNFEPTEARLVCVAAWCDAPEASYLLGRAEYDAVVPLGAPMDSASWKRVSADLGDSTILPPFAALGYDAVQVVGEAVRRATRRGELSRAAIAGELKATDVAGLLGSYGPNGRHDSVAEVHHHTSRESNVLLRRVEERQ